MFQHLGTFLLKVNHAQNVQHLLFCFLVFFRKIVTERKAWRIDEALNRNTQVKLKKAAVLIVKVLELMGNTS